MLYESRCMKSVAYHAPRTVSESCYVILGLWNRVASIYLHCRRDIQRILITILLKIWFIYFLNPSASTDMARWKDPISLETICTIVKTRIPTWNDGRMSKISLTESNPESLGSISIRSNLSLFWDCFNRDWLDDPSIRISKGEPRDDSDVVGGDSWES